MDADALYRRACDFEDAGRLAEAEATYRELLAVAPRHARAHNNLGSVLQFQGRVGEALACYVEAARQGPALWQPPYNIANYYKLTGQIERAVRLYRQAMQLKRGRGVPAISSDPTFTRTSKAKLRHDIEQLDYLIGRGILGVEYREVAAALGEALAALPADLAEGAMADFPAGPWARVADTYNRLLHFQDAPALPGGALNPALDRKAIEAAYFGHAPGLTVVDNLLRPEAIVALRRFCMESTFWFDGQYAAGYVGASVDEGFICPLLVQVAGELQQALPGIFRNERLLHLWGYKYGSNVEGIDVHGDFAAVNVNFWITPDEANLAPESGGLVVWDKEAPLDWDFEAYNKDVPRMQAFLRESGAKAVTVPHRQNRAVIFNSDLFHKTDAVRFRPGYENRRINITMLFGERSGRL